MAEHYGVAVIPARVRKPKDKAKVEVAVQIVERWILAALRKRTFFSLAELNAAIRELLEKLNNRPFKKLPGSRQSRFLELDKPALKSLPTSPYQFAQWKKARIAPDYHIELFGHYYSVPYQLVGKELDVRATDTTVECFHKSKRVASHGRSYRKGGYTTLPEHMPRNHREHAAWTPERMIRWAAKTGHPGAVPLSRAGLSDLPGDPCARQAL
jgi:transposase